MNYMPMATLPMVNKHQTAAEQAIIPDSGPVEALSEPIIDGRRSINVVFHIHIACAGEGGAD